MTVNRMCKSCGRSIIVWSTAQTRCPKCQQARSKAKPKKPIKQTGKKGTKWLAFRRKYLKNHPPTHEGYYTCYICLQSIPASEITLDHVIARSKRPDLVFNEENIRLCCGLCNTAKGSKNW